MDIYIFNFVFFIYNIFYFFNWLHNISKISILPLLKLMCSILVMVGRYFLLKQIFYRTMNFCKYCTYSISLNWFLVGMVTTIDYNGQHCKFFQAFVNRFWYILLLFYIFGFYKTFPSYCFSINLHVPFNFDMTVYIRNVRNYYSPNIIQLGSWTN